MPSFLVLILSLFIYCSTVFRLSTTKLEDSSAAPWKERENNCFLYALSTGEEAFATAQERALAKLRDTKSNANTALACDLIAPAPAIQSLMDQKGATTASAADAPVETTSLAAPRGPQKATTAAAFFGKKEKSKASTNADKSTSTTTTSSSSQTSTKPLKNNLTKAKAKPAASSSMFQRATHKAKATVKQDEKENNKRPKAVGNVDDFVGDEEESDDEEMEQQPPPPSMVRGRAPDNDQVMIDGDDEEEDKKEDQKSKAKPTVYGAMDDFAKPKEPASQQGTSDSRPHRRKRIVTKTTTDEDGYLQTETQEIWEEIPPEEVVKQAPKKAPAPSRPKKKVAKPTDMKQGSLMGFFKKK